MCDSDANSAAAAQSNELRVRAIATLVDQLTIAVNGASAAGLFEVRHSLDYFPRILYGAVRVLLQRTLRAASHCQNESITVEIRSGRNVTGSQATIVVRW